MKTMSHSITPETQFFSKYQEQTDEYGFDLNLIKKLDGFFSFFYQHYFSVKTIGLENIPADGAAILVGNHSGVLPVDAFMLLHAVIHHHPQPRRIRCLSHDYLRKSDVFKDIVCGFGGVPANYSVALKLLENNELVCFYPEGAKGTGKPFSLRYRLVDFNPGFIKAAIEKNVPIIPITTVGADEIYPLLGNLKAVAKFMEAPYWPITWAFPWLPFPFSCAPLPVKMLIKIGEPIHFNYPPERCRDKNLRLKLSKEIQHKIQSELNSLLASRKSTFEGWVD